MNTCLERYYRAHPNGKDPVQQGMCPDEFEYLEEPENCNASHGPSEFPVLMSCADCWNREIPETFKEKLTTIPEVEPDEIDLQMIAETFKEKLTTIPEVEPDEIDLHMIADVEKEKSMTTRKTKAELLEEINKLSEERRTLMTELERLEKYRKYDEAAEEMKAVHDSFVRAGFTEQQAFDIFITAMKMQQK